MMAYEGFQSARNNFGKFIYQFHPETKTLIRKLERILNKLFWQNLSLLFNETCLNKWLLSNHTHTPIYIYIYIYIYINGKTGTKSDSMKMYKYEKSTWPSGADFISLLMLNVSVFKCVNIKPSSGCVNF